jgi:uncharacterized lipoprotein YajG
MKYIQKSLVLVITVLSLSGCTEKHHKNIKTTKNVAKTAEAVAKTATLVSILKRLW